MKFANLIYSGQVLQYSTCSQELVTKGSRVWKVSADIITAVLKPPPNNLDPATSSLTATGQAFLEPFGSGYALKSGNTYYVLNSNGQLVTSGSPFLWQVVDIDISNIKSQCPSPQLWDNSTQKCVSGASLVCDQGQLYDTISKQCVDSANCTNGGVWNSITRTCTPCASGNYWDPATNLCVSVGTLCPDPKSVCDTSNTTWNGTKCVSTIPVAPEPKSFCGTNTTWDGIQQKCLPPTCPTGSVWNPTTGQCVTKVSLYPDPSLVCETTNTQWNGTKCVSSIVIPNCPTDSVWDTASGQCVTKDSLLPTCSATSLWNSSSKTCVEKNTFCGPNSNWNGSQCVALPQPTCPTDSVWDTISKTCVTKASFLPTCPVDNVWDTTTKACVTKASFLPTCPTDSVWNTSTNSCVTKASFLPTCSVGSVWDPVSKTCVTKVSFLPSCPTGSVWDTSAGVCVANSVFCGKDTTYDAISRKCVSTVNCPVAITCGQNTTLVGSQCTAPAPVMCRTGESYCGPDTIFNLTSMTCLPDPLNCTDPGLIGSSQGIVPVMTGPTTSGYVASSSLDNEGAAWLAFNGTKTPGTAPYWVSLGYSDTTGVFNQSFAPAFTRTTTTNRGTIDGQWLQIKLPSAQTVSHFDIYPVTDVPNRNAGVIHLLVSSDGVAWEELGVYKKLTWTTSPQRFKICIPKTRLYYRLIVENTVGGGQQSRAALKQWILHRCVF